MTGLPNGGGPDGPPNRLFLERRSYIQRRLIDGAKLLPIVGLVLFLVPLVWPKSDQSDAVATSNSTVYIFVIWFALIVVGAILARRITTSGTTQDESAEENASKSAQAVPFKDGLE